MLGYHITAGRPEPRDRNKAEDCYPINKKLSSESFFGGKLFIGGFAGLNSELTGKEFFPAIFGLLSGLDGTLRRFLIRKMFLRFEAP